MILYRPVNLEELRLVYETAMAAFPPRKPEQPIFYPVLNLEYASDIARKWNTQDQWGAGYVTRFTVDDTYAVRFEVHQVGAATDVELWVPAEQLGEFNSHILAPIEVVRAYFSGRFSGNIPQQFGLRGKDATAQFVALVVEHGRMEGYYEILTNHTAVFLNYAYWVQTDFTTHGITAAKKELVLEYIRSVWGSKFPGIPLPLNDGV